MESAIAVYFGELCGCGGWYVLFYLFFSFPLFLWISRPHEKKKKLLILYENVYRSLPHRLRGKRRSEIFWCVFGGDSFDCEWTLYFDVAGE